MRSFDSNIWGSKTVLKAGLHRVSENSQINGKKPRYLTELNITIPNDQ